MVPETAGSTSVCRHQFLTTSSRSRDDCDTSRLHSLTYQPTASTDINYHMIYYTSVLERKSDNQINGRWRVPVEYYSSPPSNCCFQHSTKTLNFDLLTPESKAFVSISKSINALILVKSV